MTPAAIVRQLQVRVRGYQRRSAERYTTDDVLKDRHDEAAREDPPPDRPPSASTSA
ncbi:hypothetical protein [Elioraea sp.]|uniref:hypothetical protein n=1 Tax=Elioraea sp. TaxID=2185103 RepID=UPI003F72127D